MPKRRLFILREKIYKFLFIASDKVKLISKSLMIISQIGFAITGVAFITAALLYIGFAKSEAVIIHPSVTFRLFFILLFCTKFVAEILKFSGRKRIFWIVDGTLFFWGLALFIITYFRSDPVGHLTQQLRSPESYLIISALLIFSKIYKLAGILESSRIPPSLLFAASFLAVILAGSGLLMLPKAHTQTLSYLDALFTSTSAVCVTGLIVVDTATAFTMMGKTIILLLIQAGGLGIMAFTLFFSFVFTGSFSFRDNMLLKDIFSAEKMGGMLKVLLKIMGLTFLIELLGIIFIWMALPGVPDEGKFFFSLFHSVSAFCNAGFSTLSNNLYETGFRDNHLLGVTIAILIILGGIGFPVLLYITTKIYRSFLRFSSKISGIKIIPKEFLHDLNTRIVLITTFFLLAGGTLLYYLMEEKTSLTGLTNSQKAIVSFFGSVSARTAGFNITDVAAWGYPTVFLMIFLMWVGASPGSTGGGIKTTTFALAVKTAFGFLGGKETIEIGHREIGMNTIIRVLSVIILSILAVALGFFGLMLTESGRNPVHLLFEAVSAYGTVGLSIANTSTISSAGKIIIICMMFIGRIGPLTLLSAFLLRSKRKYYSFPKEDLIIN